MLGLLAALFVAGMATGAALAVAVIYQLPAPARPALPAASARQVARDRRRNRADLRRVLPAREQGVRVVDAQPLVFRDIPPRLERLSEPPSFLPDVRAFDEDPTHG